MVLTRRAVEREKGQPIVIDLRDTCLAGVRTDKADLTGISLVGSDLHGADLAFARGDLVGFAKANLSGVNFYRADLTGSFIDLKDVDLTGARLDSAKIRSCRLSNVKLVNADLEGADLSNAKLTGVDLTGATHDSLTKTEGATYDATSKGAWW